MKASSFMRMAWLSLIAAGGLLAACSSSNDPSPFLPPGTPPPGMVDPMEPMVFNGDTAAFLVFLRDLDTMGDPLDVNGGTVVFTDTAGNTHPIPVNN